MSGDFVIGIVVFMILVTVNFLVITKGATRIAEVGARFTLDAIPGKQMAIDADLNAGLITDKEAQTRRSELEEESAFFGSMDGASKFVRGEAVASLITIAVNIFGGIIIGVTRHGLPLGEAADIYTRLSVGDGLVSQIPALIVSLAAGLLVSKGGTRGRAEVAVLGQLGAYPRALFVSAGMMFGLAIMPGLPFVPFALLGATMAFVGYAIPRKLARQRAEDEAKQQESDEQAARDVQNSVKESLRTAEIEVGIGKQLSGQVLRLPVEVQNRIAKMRRKFALRYGFVVPDIRMTESLSVPAKNYQIRIHGTVVSSQEMRIGELLVVLGDGARPDVPGDDTREPAFGMKA
ncbi:MAG: EscV/YscV/HrcV family type III secretion system export apparatus protein, partial [Azorhizobium sp. 35-67-15]